MTDLKDVAFDVHLSLSTRRNLYFTHLIFMRYKSRPDKRGRAEGIEMQLGTTLFSSIH